MDEFVALVEEMRASQKEYFRTHASSMLNKCKTLERRVDRAITEYKMMDAPKQAKLI